MVEHHHYNDGSGNLERASRAATEVQLQLHGASQTKSAEQGTRNTAFGGIRNIPNISIKALSNTLPSDPALMCLPALPDGPVYYDGLPHVLYLSSPGKEKRFFYTDKVIC